MSDDLTAARYGLSTFDCLKVSVSPTDDTPASPLTISTATTLNLDCKRSFNSPFYGEAFLQLFVLDTFAFLKKKSSSSSWSSLSHLGTRRCTSVSDTDGVV